jgi:hypothetical protein
MSSVQVDVFEIMGSEIGPVQEITIRLVSPQEDFTLSLPDSLSLTIRRSTSPS